MHHDWTTVLINIRLPTGATAMNSPVTELI
jgi:hypothetical protein